MGPSLVAFFTDAIELIVCPTQRQQQTYEQYNKNLSAVAHSAQQVFALSLSRNHLGPIYLRAAFNIKL